MKKIGNFEVVKKLGEGGMANVYLIKGANNDYYALKELKKELLADDVLVQRFYYESHTIKSFKCDNIIKIIAPTKWVNVYEDNVPVGKSYVYVMENTQSISVKDLIQQRKLSIQEAKSILIGLMTALDYSHSKGIVHRDIKPANLLVKENKDLTKVVLTDFGIAKIHKSLKSGLDGLTVDISILGAPAYMSPEQISDARAVTNKSDLYSAGVMFYELLTGKKPYVGEKWDVIAQHKDPKVSPIPPSRIRSQIDAQTNELVLRLLEKKPKARPNNARDVLNLLTDTITMSPEEQKNNWPPSFYISKPLIRIESKFNEKVYSQSFSLFPVTIGRYTKETSTVTKYSLPPELKGVSRSHCEIFINEKSQLLIKDTSTYGTNINNVSLSKTEHPLKQWNNDLVLANHYRIKIQLIEQKNLNSFLIAAIIGLSVILAIIITVLVSINY